MIKVIRLLVLFFLGLSLGASNLHASAMHGKAFYIKNLKQECGFNGEVMAKKYTAAEWQMFYNEKKLGAMIKYACPKAPYITDDEDLENLYHFFSTFASDSGNVPSSS